MENVSRWPRTTLTLSANAWYSYIIFGVFCTVMTIHIFFTYPETARKTLEEIDIVFDSKIPPWKTGKVQEHALEVRAQSIDRTGTRRVSSVGFDEKDGDTDRKEVV